MTQDEISEALGEDWTRNIPAGLWSRKVNGVTFEVTPEYLGKRCWVDRIEFGDDQSTTTFYRCPDDESAVAVAHLLVAAEQIANGADVADACEMPTTPVSAVALPEPDAGFVRLLGTITFTRRKARRAAIDLLRAAAEAEKDA